MLATFGGGFFVNKKWPGLIWNDTVDKLGSMVRINGLFHLLINGVYWGYNPLTNIYQLPGTS